MEKYQVLLAVISPDWIGMNDAVGNRRRENAQDFVRIEIETALKRSIPGIPLLVRGARMVGEKTEKFVKKRSNTGISSQFSFKFFPPFGRHCVQVLRPAGLVFLKLQATKHLRGA